MLKLRRYRPFALAALAAPALLLADAAHGASYVLLSSNLGQAHTCRVSVQDRLGGLVVAQSDYLRVDSMGAMFDIGDFPVGADGDIRKFGSLTVICWEPTVEFAGTPPPATTPSYSLTLGYQDPGWVVPNADGTGHARVLPRNDFVLHLQIERTADAQRLFRITDAALRRWYPPAPAEVVYGTLLHRALNAD